ncbi:MAG: adenosine deaminase family protein [Verrucomicrobia bacterium]|nr:MAG: adenosine deaminase family protein [Verrucomicrobiota bacterium]
MNAGLTKEFIQKIPKTDLHLHLDGSLRLPTLIELARRARVKLPSQTADGLCRLVFKKNYRNLGEYLRGFGLTCAVLQAPENLERVAFELAEDCLAEGVRYIEVRFAPQLHCHDRLNIEGAVTAVCRGLARAQRAHNRSRAVQNDADLPFHFGVILCALRAFTATTAPYYAQLFSVMPYAPRRQVFAAASLEIARAAADLAHRCDLPVVGFDLAGEEAGYPAEHHAAAYQLAHRHFIRKTVHAGEAYGPESIFQAITECHANRIGHGTFLFAADMIRNPAVGDPQAYVRHLAEYIASQRINIEVCLTSNLQTVPQMKRFSDHPLKQMLAHSLSVSINTDNRLVSHTTVCHELELAATHFDIQRHQFRNLVIAGFKGSFFPGTYTEKRAYVRRVIDRYEALERELLPLAM